MKKFPCPYCRGQGSWVEPVLDDGTGPTFTCGGCGGDGMIEVDGPVHRQMKDAKRMTSLIYLATPYSKFPGGIVDAFATAARLSAKLITQGYLVYSPIVHTHPIATLGGIDPFDHDVWLPFDEAMMRVSKTLMVATLAGWRESVGVSHEIEYFELHDKPILYVNPETLETSEEAPE